ncbi:MAG: Holliday junction resolvase RuvX [Betaproteobacteria bacterium]
MPDHVPPPLGAPAPCHGAVLAFDFGLRRTGVAVGDMTVGIAHPVTTIDGADRVERMRRVEHLVTEWQPVLFVVGMPMRDDGEEHALAPAVRKFGGQLHGRFGLPVIYVDETLTSNAGERALAEAGVHGIRRKAVLDQAAAQEILQSFFETPHACA